MNDDALNAATVLTPVTQALLSSRTLDELVPPLLQALQSLTGLESVYLTRVDEAASAQTVVFARNQGTLNLAVGLTVPWQDTLCRRALQSEQTVCTDVAQRWPDARAAIELGIRTYLTAPIRLVDGRLWGTLCAAGAQPRAVPQTVQQVLQLLSILIGQFIDRERLAQRLLQENDRLRQTAHTDALTNLPNRQALMDALQRFWPQDRDHALLVLFIDLDDFKVINDRLGHHQGDVFLRLQGQRLRRALRPGDFLARYGGDEFVVLAPLRSVPSDAFESTAAALVRRLRDASMGHFKLQDDVTVAYTGASIGWSLVTDHHQPLQEALARADAAMYRDKARPRAGPVVKILGPRA